MKNRSVQPPYNSNQPWGRFVVQRFSESKTVFRMAILASMVPLHAQATTSATPSVIVNCDTCTTYSDLAAYAATTAGKLANSPYSPTVSYQPGYTKILVTATSVPKSFTFDYSTVAHTTNWVTYYTATVTPVTAFAASDDGAIGHDFALYQGARASGIPIIQIPNGATLPDGTPVTENTWGEYLGPFLRSIMVPIPNSAGLSTLPGLANWKFYPSVTVLYQGNKYKLYEGEKITIKFADGATMQATAHPGLFASPGGMFDFGPVTPAPSTSHSGVPAQPGAFSSASLPSYGPISQMFDGPPVYVNSGVNGTVSGSVTISEPDVPGFPTTTYYYEFDFEIG